MTSFSQVILVNIGQAFQLGWDWERCDNVFTGIIILKLAIATLR